MSGYIVRIGDREYHIEVLDDHHVRLNGEIIEVDLATLSDSPLFSLIVNGKSYEVLATPQGETWEVHLKGHTYLKWKTKPLMRCVEVFRLIPPNPQNISFKPPCRG